MIRHPLPRAAVLLALAWATACDSAAEPETQNPLDLALDFCSNDIPVWIAYRNQGEGWTRLTPTADGTVSFTATNDVSLAFVHQNGADYRTEFIHAANFELEDVSGLTCREESGVKTVNGTVSGVVGSQVSLVGMSYSSVYLSAAQTSFSLTNLPERPLDVVATRVNIVGTSQSADRIIIRRSQNFLNAASMPVLNFGGSEAVTPTAFGLTVSGVGTNEQAFIANYFTSQLETSLLLSYSQPVLNGAHTAYGVPGAELAQGDYHTAFAVVVGADGESRGSQRYFRVPGAQTLPIAAAMSAPTVQQAAATPYLRLRTTAARDAQYGQAIRADFVQESSFSATSVAVTVTANYSGSGSWDATMPDMSGVTGWQNAWGLSATGAPVDWTVTVYGGNPALLFGAPPNDGELVRFATTPGSLAPAGAARAAAPGTMKRSARVLGRTGPGARLRGIAHPIER